MKTTAFTQYHLELGAKMAPFAGYNMPIEYSGINKEHEIVREKVGVFDVSHMGNIWVKGVNATQFLQYVTSNDVSVLTEGKIQYTYFPNETGGVVDDLLVYCINNETYMLVVNASNIEKDWNFLCKYADKFGVTVGKDLYNASDEMSILAIQGPLAMQAVQKIVDEDITDLTYYTFRKVNIAGIKDAILSITGYTGSGGCEIYIDNKDAPKLWKALFEAGKEFGMEPVGLGARDTLRLEMGYCLYGNDIDDTTSPIEAGLGWVTKPNKGDFVAKQIIEEKKKNIKQKLVGFELVDRGIPRQGYEVSDGKGNVIGRVTSGTMSPTLKKPVGMAYVDISLSTPDSEIYIIVRNKELKAKVVKPPFYKK